MNVNPFSYLIEKLKSKVSKTGDTMTGNLIISRNAATSELELGNNTTSKGLIILFSNNDKYEVLRSPDGMTANRNIYLPDASGTLALTSDIVYPTQRTKLATIDVGETTKDVTPSHNGYLMANINAGGSTQDVTIGVRNSAYFGTASTTNIEIWHGGYGPIMPCKAGVTYTYFDVHGHVSTIDIYECY